MSKDNTVQPERKQTDDIPRPLERLVVRRFLEMPRRYTFEMDIAKQILKSHCVGTGWVDPFAGYNSPAEYTNDINPEAPTVAHMDAVAFLNGFGDCSVEGILVDPPYSMHQVVISYRGYGVGRVNSLTPVYDEAARICKVGGKVISWGWNTNGIGAGRRFELREVYVIAHGGHHNDTLVSVEIKGFHETPLFTAPDV